MESSIPVYHLKLTCLLFQYYFLCHLIGLQHINSRTNFYIIAICPIPNQGYGRSGLNMHQPTPPVKYNWCLLVGALWRKLVKGVDRLGYKVIKFVGITDS